MTSGNAARTGAVARACRLEGARAHLQALLTSLAHHGLHRTQPPDIRDHRQQAVICAITQLRLARAQAEDRRLPWGTAPPGGRLTPAGVRRDFDRLLAVIGTPASPPKPCRAGRAGHRPAGR